ncbi:MAG: putative toxin-antitoxin system toxin component, PIN family [Gammaproteobacteria bacterium]|nr:putative toxin-antitoxin system toxin component, PIN family [Gammaproteobacteria bacterium]
MRVVLDTGILIAALITTDTPPALIYQAWRKKRFELITSDWQLDEFRRVSRYSKLRRFLKPGEAGNLVNGLRLQATVLEVLPTVDLSPDPDDNPVLAMAKASQAQYLVTGDKRDLLALGTIGGTHIVTARQFVDALGI